MEAPTKITPRSVADYFEVLTKAVFQSGISWRVVEAKWPGFQRALYGFDPAAVARLTPADVDRLLDDSGIIRNRRKLEATIDNAVETVALEKRFRFLGDLGAYYFLYVTGEKVPTHNEWKASRNATSPRRGKTRRPSPRRRCNDVRRGISRGRAAPMAL